MFCRFCGVTIPDDSTFCHSCGKSVITSEARLQSSDSGATAVPTAAPSNLGKKIGATVLIVLLSVWLVAAPYSQTLNPPRDLEQAIIDLIVVLLLMTALIFSIKWRLKLAGFVNTSGRQAVAIFLIAFCAWGLVLVVMMSKLSEGGMRGLVAIVMGALYVFGIYASARWLKKLRRSERAQTAIQPPSSLAAAP